MAAGRLDQTILITSRDELGQMAEAFSAMTTYLNHMAAVAHAIARGDLRQDVQPQSGEDVLGMAFQAMVLNLRKLTAELQESSQELAASANQILGAMSHQSSSASEQAAAVAETTATIDEVRVSAEQAAELADQVSAASGQASEVAGRGVTALEAAT